MTDLRRSALTGAETIIVGHRQKRPNLPSNDCPFCPGGLEAPEHYDVRAFVNRWAPLPENRCEVLLYSPLHDATLASVGVHGVRAVAQLWADRSAALGTRSDVGYVLIFENRGAEVGATIAHPHGQVYAFDSVPPAASTELSQPSCSLCEPAAPELVIQRAQGWTAHVPSAATWPFELICAPDRHVPDLTDDACDLGGLASVLHGAMTNLDAVFGEPMPYMLWIHQRPFDGGEWPMAHLHVHIAGLYRSPATPRFVAAGELGSGVYFNPLEPNEAADRLRNTTS